jgi:NADPH-dependent 2,4-dienoyl-CoA reductase/sulfur reductase-like enzyme
MLDHEVGAFGGEHRLEYVEAKNGVCVAADIAVVGIGVVPNVDLLDGSGVAVEDGVVVDRRFETSAAGVYAAGDVANFFDPLFDRRRRIEHWSNANYQGTEVGKVLAGRDGRYDTVSSFFTEVFGVGLKVFGDVTRFDELTLDGTLESGLLAGYGNGGRLVGAITVGQSEELESVARALIAEQAPTRALHDDLVASVRS